MMMALAACAVALAFYVALVGSVFVMEYLGERREERERRREEIERILREHEDADAPGAGSSYSLNGAPEDP